MFIVGEILILSEHGRNMFSCEYWQYAGCYTWYERQRRQRLPAYSTSAVRQPKVDSTTGRATRHEKWAEPSVAARARYTARDEAFHWSPADTTPSHSPVRDLFWAVCELGASQITTSGARVMQRV